MEKIFRLLLRHGFRKGILGGNRYWVAAGALGGAGLIWKKFSAKINSPKTIFSEELKPGKIISFTNDGKGLKKV